VRRGPRGRPTPPAIPRAATTTAPRDRRASPEVAPADVADLAEFPVGDQLPGVSDRGDEPVVEPAAGDRVGLAGGVPHRRRRLEARREGLLTQDVGARLQGGDRRRRVAVVRPQIVEDVDSVDHVPPVGRGRLEAQSVGRGRERGLLPAHEDRPLDVGGVGEEHRQPSEGVGVGPPHKSVAQHAHREGVVSGTIGFRSCARFRRRHSPTTDRRKKSANRPRSDDPSPRRR
jgi:hypothetical protein